MYQKGVMMIGSVLKEAREALNLKQEDVANIIKVTKQTYLKWENNSTEPKASQIKELAEALNITADEICNGKKNQNYDLEKFINKLAEINPKREIEVLRNWKSIRDHERYFIEFKSNKK